jgi:hypothetical protein
MLPSLLEDDFVPLHDEESENEKEKFENYKMKDEYYNKSQDPKRRKVEVQEGKEILNTKMKNEMENLKKFNEFEKNITNKQRVFIFLIYHVCTCNMKVVCRI